MLGFYTKQHNKISSNAHYSSHHSWIMNHSSKVNLPYNFVKQALNTLRSLLIGSINQYSANLSLFFFNGPFPRIDVTKRLKISTWVNWRSPQGLAGEFLRYGSKEIGILKTAYTLGSMAKVWLLRKKRIIQSSRRLEHAALRAHLWNFSSEWHLP